MKHVRYTLVSLLLVLCSMIFFCTTAAAAEQDDGTSEATLEWGVKENADKVELILQDLDEQEAIFAVQLDLYFSSSAEYKVEKFIPTKSDAYSAVKELPGSGSYGTYKLLSVYISSQTSLDDVMDAHRTIDLGELQFTGNKVPQPARAHMTVLNKDLKPMDGLDQYVKIITEKLPDTCTVRFIDGITDGEISSFSVEKGKTVGPLPSAPEHTGYKFTGWYAKYGSQFTASTVVKNDTTVTAKYVKQSGNSNRPDATDPDESKTTVVTNPDGSKTATTKDDNGVVGKTTTNTDGKVVSVEVTIPSAAVSAGKTIIAPVKVKAVKDSDKAPEISVSVESNNSVRVEIPVENSSSGIVAVLVYADGTEKLIRDCAIGDNGVVLDVKDSAVVKIVDKSRDFADVPDENYWAGDAVQFVAARELFKGVSETEFAPDGAMTRGMIVTVLHRLAYEPESVASDFGDVAAGAYYADAVAWAESNGVVKGCGDGTFAPDQDVTREQLVTILYRYAKDKGIKTSGGADLSRFADAQTVGSYATDAMSWAVGVGLVNGVDENHLQPVGDATRAQVAAILMRFCNAVL